MGKDYQQVIKRFLNGEGDEQDKQLINQWFCQYETENELLEKLHEYWDGVSAEVPDEEYDESIILGRIYRQLKINDAMSNNKATGVQRLVNIFTKVAAILFIPLLIAFFLKDEKLITPTAGTSYTEIHSPPGSRIMFYLPDGSKGWLNSGSSLRYAEGFPGKSRKVHLSGEAFFDVKSNPKKPFVVASRNLDIVSKGTSFNVQAWNDMPDVKVILGEGKLDIYFNDPKESVLKATLNQGDMLSWKPLTLETQIQKVDVHKYTSWTKGMLVFRDDPFTEVVRRINHWYNVNLVIKDKILESYTYVATFHDETLDELLKMLTISSPITYKNVERRKSADGTYEKRVVELYYSPRTKTKK